MKALAVLSLLEIGFTGVIAWRYVRFRSQEDPAVHWVTRVAVVSWFIWTAVAFCVLARVLWDVRL